MTLLDIDHRSILLWQHRASQVVGFVRLEMGGTSVIDCMRQPASMM